MGNPDLLQANRRLAALHLLLQATVLFALPLWLLPRDPAWGWLILPAVLMSNPWWAFVHEALHGVMFDDRRWNRLSGRLNAVLYGAPFDLLRWGHLLHHAHSRTVRERSEVYVAGQDNRLRFAMGYYFRLFGGLYVYEVIGGLLLLLPRPLVERLIAGVASRDNVIGELGKRLMEPATLAAVRADALAIAAVYSLAFALYGLCWWMLLAALAGRAVLISLVDNAFHYGTPLDDVRFARNLELPGWASRLMLHFNLHGAHHARARLPWRDLPEYHRQSAAGFQDRWLAAVFRQLRGPLAEQCLPRREGGSGSTKDIGVVAG